MQVYHGQRAYELIVIMELAKGVHNRAPYNLGSRGPSVCKCGYLYQRLSKSRDQFDSVYGLTVMLELELINGDIGCQWIVRNGVDLKLIDKVLSTVPWSQFV